MLQEREKQLQAVARSQDRRVQSACPPEQPGSNEPYKSVVHAYDVCSWGVGAAVRLPPAGYLLLVGGLDAGISV